MITCRKCDARIPHDPLCSDLAVLTCHWIRDHTADYLRAHPEAAPFLSFLLSPGS